MNEYFDLFSKKPAEGLLFIACAMLIMAFIKGVAKGIVKSISNKS